MEGLNMVTDGDQRNVLTCPLCGLKQFDRDDKTHCVRCHRHVFRRPDEPEPVPEPETPSAAAPDAWREQLAWNIKFTRQRRHLTQSGLAEKLQAPRTWISKLENQKAVPTLQSLERLASNLEVTPADLLADLRMPRHEHEVFMEQVQKLAGKLDESSKVILVEAAKKMRDGRYTLLTWCQIGVSFRLGYGGTDEGL